MPATKAETGPTGSAPQERAAMKERSAELRAEDKKGAKAADGLRAAPTTIAEMPPDDRALAEQVHAIVTSAAPELQPKTWYGMPAYANPAGKVASTSRTPAKFKSGPRRRASRTPRTSTTATSGPPRTRCSPWSPEGREAGRGPGQGRRLRPPGGARSGDAELVALGIEHHDVAEVVAVCSRAPRSRRRPSSSVPVTDQAHALDHVPRRIAGDTDVDVHRDSWRSCPRDPRNPIAGHDLGVDDRRAVGVVVARLGT